LIETSPVVFFSRRLRVRGEIKTPSDHPELKEDPMYLAIYLVGDTISEASSLVLERSRGRGALRADKSRAFHITFEFLERTTLEVSERHLWRLLRGQKSCALSKEISL
jgi:hypothetical protein